LTLLTLDVRAAPPARAKQMLAVCSAYSFILFDLIRGARQPKFTFPLIITEVKPGSEADQQVCVSRV
jgi:hypothetical protein